MYLISHTFAQGNYILLILYSWGLQVNSIFLDFPWDIETWTWPKTFSASYSFHRATAHTDRNSRKELCNLFAWSEHIFGRIMFFLNLSYRVFRYVNELMKEYTLYIFWMTAALHSLMESQLELCGHGWWRYKEQDYTESVTWAARSACIFMQKVCESKTSCRSSAFWNQYTIIVFTCIDTTVRFRWELELNLLKYVQLSFLYI